MNTALLRVLTAVVLAVVTAASWWAWMGTHEIWHGTDGPYQLWQGVGCGLTILLAGVLAAVLVHPLTLVVVPFAFTVAWSATMFPGDDTGLAGVGAVMAFVGLSFASAVVAAVAVLARSSWPALRR